MIGGAAVARAWSGYLDSIFNHRIRNFTESHVMRWDAPFLATYPDFLAAGILLVAAFFISFGVRVSSWLNHIFSTISMVVIAFILVFGFALADLDNWSARKGGFAPYGFSGVMAGTATCFYAFVGFDVIAASSEEARDPRKAVPMATAISLALAATAYILVSMVLTLMVPWNTLDPNSALSDAFFRRGYSWAGLVVAVGSICAMNTVLLSNLFSLPRIVYAMAEDGLFFSIFSRVNPVTKVPVIAILVFGSLMAFLALIFDLEALVQFCPSARCQQSNSGSELKEDSSELKEYESFSDKLRLVEKQKFPGTLRARWEPYLGTVLGDWAPGEVVAFSVLALMHPAECVSYDEAQFAHLAQIHHLGLLVYFGYGIWHSKEGLKEPQCVSARYVVLPSGSLVETVQNVQPEGHTHTPATPTPAAAVTEPQANR
ncbi:Cationic amino acid transporter 4 [Bagarius yarrelli]|uniref:Cationic amino acid transporter 4 n=1 Tax=Bagarius yarrelli TaxID=175774 RepID=A0A556VUI5_BAGYA|nr:Cationic amino acid transporter 4 [Bagarius yarrelli]